MAAPVPEWRCQISTAHPPAQKTARLPRQTGVSLTTVVGVPSGGKRHGRLMLDIGEKDIPPIVDRKPVNQWLWTSGLDCRPPHRAFCRRIVKQRCGPPTKRRAVGCHHRVGSPLRQAQRGQPKAGFDQRRATVQGLRNTLLTSQNQGSMSTLSRRAPSGWPLGYGPSVQDRPTCPSGFARRGDTGSQDRGLTGTYRNAAPGPDGCADNSQPLGVAHSW